MNAFAPSTMTGSLSLTSFEIQKYNPAERSHHDIGIRNSCKKHMAAHMCKRIWISTSLTWGFFFCSQHFIYFFLAHSHPLGCNEEITSQYVVAKNLLLEFSSFTLRERRGPPTTLGAACLRPSKFFDRHQIPHQNASYSSRTAGRQAHGQG